MGVAKEEKAQALGSPQGLTGSFYTTIAEVVKKPALFDGQRVRLRGRVAEVRNTTFKLTDDAGNAVKVVPAESTSVQQGLEVTVAGKLTVSRVSDALPSLVEMREAHILFTPSAGKVTAQPAVTPQPGQSRPSPPVGSPHPAEKNEGRVF
jgi:hypothetical protein